MTNRYPDNPLSIGRTLLVCINRVTDGAGATVLAKIEGRNPACSVKCTPSRCVPAFGASPDSTLAGVAMRKAVRETAAIQGLD